MLEGGLRTRSLSPPGSRSVFQAQVSYPWKRGCGGLGPSSVGFSIHRPGAGCVPLDAWLRKPPRVMLVGFSRACGLGGPFAINMRKSGSVAVGLKLAVGCCLPSVGWAGSCTIAHCRMEQVVEVTISPVLGGRVGTGERSPPAAGAGALQKHAWRTKTYY